jgi:hypothetical protein
VFAQTLPQGALPPIPSDGLGNATRESLAAMNDCLLNIAKMQPPPTGPAKFRELRKCGKARGP